MHVPHNFAASDEDMVDLLTNHGAADLVTFGESGFSSTVVPLIYDPDDGSAGALVGHVAKANDHWKVGECDALAIMRGADCYVSPGWYRSKREHGRVVPTWNYAAAHVRGRVEWTHDVTWLEDVVGRLTAKHEALTGVTTPWTLADAPRQYVEAKLQAIVGVRLQIDRVDVALKMSQNRSDEDTIGVIEGLQSVGDTRSAAAVRAANPSTRSPAVE